MFDTNRTLQQGLGLHQAGRLSEAEQFYRQILAVDPDHADGLHLLGVIAHATGHNEAAVDLIGKAIARNNRVADFHCNIGAALHALGRVTEAETHYRRAIKLNPDHVESYNNFGNVLKEQGKLDEAQRQFKRALARRPNYADAHYNLGNVLLDLGRTDEAIRHYQQAIALNPAMAKAHYNLGQALRAQGKLDEAVACYQYATAFEPSWAEAHRALATVLLKLDRRTDAEACFRRAHEADPNAIAGLQEWVDTLELLGRKEEALDVRNHLCKLAPQEAKHWFDLGLGLQQTHRAAEARKAYLRAHEIEPDYPYLRNNLAATFLDLDQPQEARDILEPLITGDQQDALSLINLGIACRQTFQLGRSAELFERAIAVDPNNALAYSNYGLTLKELQRWNEANAMFERALAIDPSFIGARWNLAMSQLLQGDYTQGWINHEARWEGSPELRGKTRGGLDQPEWKGEPLTGKTLFVWGEQGFGDALQFARYVPLIAERVKREGGRMRYCCFGRLLPLFRRSFEGCFEVVVPDTCRPLPEFDYHCPLLSLPLRFGTTLDTLPAQTPYLSLDEHKVEAWRERLASEVRFKVGLVWTGNPTHQRNPFRAVGLDAYAAAFKNMSDVAFYSLQFDAAEDIRRAQANGLEIIDYTTEMKDYDDSAAFMRNMDLIITICTSAAHLAGAIAARTWLLLDVNPHWVWLTERSDSPWYPTLTLYRQSAYREWAPVMARLQADLAALAQQHTRHTFPCKGEIGAQSEPGGGANTTDLACLGTPTRPPVVALPAVDPGSSPGQALPVAGEISPSLSPDLQLDRGS
jgi:tetratricopeptide (TPR) repeat protein